MSAILAFVVAHIDLILLILLAVSEYLAMTKRVKANSILQLVIQALKKIKGKDKLVG